MQGLFERHKLIVATQLCMAILKKNGELQQQKFDFLLRGPKVMGMENPLKEWVLDSVWGSVQALKASASHKPLGTLLCFAAERDLGALYQPVRSCVKASKGALWGEIEIGQRTAKENAGLHCLDPELFLTGK